MSTFVRLYQRALMNKTGIGTYLNMSHSTEKGIC